MATSEENLEGPGQLGATEDRPLPPASGGIAAAEVTPGPKLAEFLGDLLLVCPLQTEEWETSMGKADVLVSQILRVEYTLDGDNAVSVDWEDLGEVPVFWNFVKRQLTEKSTPEFPWVLGRLDKGSRAYRLADPTAEDLRAAEVALAKYRESTESDF